MIIRATNLVLPGATDEDAPALCIDNVVDVSSISTNTEATGYPATNLANPATFLKWRNTVTTAENIVISIPGTSNPNYLGVAAHNFGSTLREIKLQGDAGAGYVDITDWTQVPDDSPILFLFAQAAYTDIRLALRTGATDVAEVGVIYCGEALMSQRNIYVGHNPITMSKRQIVANGYSLRGDFLGRIITGEKAYTNISLSELTPGWVRGDLYPFLVQARSRPFFFGWRPATYPTEIGYVWLAGDPAPVNSRANGMMAIDFDVEGLA